MVQRTSERLNLQPGRTPEVAVQASGRVGPQNTGGIFDGQIATKYPDLVAPPSGELNPIVQALFKTGAQITETMVQREQQEAYLNGALAVGMGESIDQIEASPLTRQWANAGYRDTVGRLAMANYEAQVAKDMTRLRESGPDAMANYLKYQRQQLMPTVDSMSFEARKQLFSQILTSEQSSLAAHAKAHTEFQVNTKMTALQTGYSVVARKIFETDGPSDPRYNSALAATASYLLANVWDNQELPKEAKVTLMMGAVESAMAQGDVGLYRVIQEANVLGADGKPTSLWGQFDFKSQTTLAKAYQTALGKNDAKINASWWDNTHKIAVEMAQGRVPLDFDSYNRHLQQGVNMGSISPAQQESRLVEYAKLSGKKNESMGVLNAVLLGDPKFLIENNVSDTEAAKIATREILAINQQAGKPLAATFDMVANIGIERGNKEMLAQATELIRPQIDVLMNSQDVNVSPEAASVLQNFTQKVDAARQAGNVSAQANFLKLLPPAQQDFMRTYFAVRRKYASESMGGDNPDHSAFLVSETRKLTEWRANMSDGERKAFMIKGQENAEKAVLDLRSTGKLGEYGGAITGLFSETTRNQLKLTSTGKWMNNDSAYLQHQNTVQNAILDEYRELNLTEFGWEPQDLAEKAMANVANRTLSTDFGVVVLPRDADVRAMLGVPASAGNDIVTKAINRVLQANGANPDDYTSFNIGNGTFTAQQINYDGVATKNFQLLPADVGRVASDIMKDQDTVYNDAFGSGRVIKSGDGAEVRFNGENTASVPPKIAVDLRAMLVKQEGIKTRPYPDGDKGRMSVGVGMNSGGDWYPKPYEFNPDGTVKQDAMNFRFARASDAAISSAVKAIDEWNFNKGDRNLMELFTSMAYQGGDRFYVNRKAEAGYQAFLTRMKGDNPDEALSTLRKTYAYKAAGADRRKFYEERVMNHFNK